MKLFRVIAALALAPLSFAFDVYDALRVTGQEYIANITGHSQSDGATVIMNSKAVNLSLPESGGYRLATFGQVITTGNLTLDEFLCQGNYSLKYNDEAIAWCDAQLGPGSSTELYAAHINTFYFQYNIHDADLYSVSMPKEKFVIGLVDLMRNWDGNSQSGNNKVHIVIPAGGEAYLSMYNGDSKSDEDVKCLQGLNTQLGDKVGIPEAMCIRVSTQNDQRGWTMAYGNNFNSVVSINCGHINYTEKERTSC